MTGSTISRRRAARPSRRAEIVRLDHSPNGARNAGAAQLRAMLGVRQTCLDEFGCTHQRSSRLAAPDTLQYRGQSCCQPMLAAATQREKHSVRCGTTYHHNRSQMIWRSVVLHPVGDWPILRPWALAGSTAAKHTQTLCSPRRCVDNGLTLVVKIIRRSPAEMTNLQGE